MAKKKKMLKLIILVMSIGFAAVSTTLYINGSIKISSNKENFENGVIFTHAETNYGTATISEDGKTITYVTENLEKMNEVSKLDFTIKNKSNQYDADASIECFMLDENNKYNNYVTITPNSNKYYISSGKSIDGYLNTTLIMNVLEDAQVEFQCKISANAVERTASGVVYEFDALDYMYSGNEELECNNVQCAITKLNELIEIGE